MTAQMLEIRLKIVSLHVLCTGEASFYWKKYQCLKRFEVFTVVLMDLCVLTRTRLQGLTARKATIHEVSSQLRTVFVCRGIVLAVTVLLRCGPRPVHLQPNLIISQNSSLLVSCSALTFIL
jgi:hypothetical protein